MPLNLVYRPAAISDLDAIYAYIEPKNPERAAGFINEIRERCRILCAYPELGPKRDTLSPGIPMPNRITVAYRLTQSTIEITRVFSSGQDYEA